jgi:hypothetical protein
LAVSPKKENTAAEKQESKQSEEKVRQSPTKEGQTGEQPFQTLNKKLKEHNDWLNKCDDELLEKHVKLVDELENERLMFELKEVEKELPYREAIFKNDFNRFYSKLTGANEKESAENMNKVIAEKYAQVRKSDCFFFYELVGCVLMIDCVKFQTNQKLKMKKELLEKSAQQLKWFQDELNSMNNWINNVHLDLIKQQATSTNGQQAKSNLLLKLSNMHSQQAHRQEEEQRQKEKSGSSSSNASSPSPSASSYNLLDSNVNCFEIILFLRFVLCALLSLKCNAFNCNLANRIIQF